jgi:hypothetical protein
MMLFDLLQKEGLDEASRERVKQASRELLASIKVRLAELDRFWEKEQTSWVRKWNTGCSPTKFSDTDQQLG